VLLMANSNALRHHSDEFGATSDEVEPAEIAKIHSQEVDFVLKWLDDFRPKH
jgi:hypothetical protein